MQKSVACRLMPEISRCRAVVLKQIARSALVRPPAVADPSMRCTTSLRLQRSRRHSSSSAPHSSLSRRMLVRLVPVLTFWFMRLDIDLTVPVKALGSLEQQRQ